MAAVEGVLGDQREVSAQQVRQSGLTKPIPVQAPLRARIEQAVDGEHLQHLYPIGALAALVEPFPPEAFQRQLLP